MIISQRGYDQGCSLAATGFASAVTDAFIQSAILCRIPLNPSYEDDINLVDRLSNANTNLAEYKRVAASIGLSLQPTKTEIHVHPSRAGYKCAHGCTVKSSLNMSVLGGHVGDDQYICDELNYFIDHGRKGLPLKTILHVIKTMPDTQIAWALLHYCLNYSKVMHILRSTPPSLIIESGFAQRVDALTLDALQHHR